MKVVALFLVVFVAVAYGETCHDDDDCHLTACTSGKPMCLHRLCTCASSTATSCSGRDDCMSSCQGHRDFHCVDGKCVCRH